MKKNKIILSIITILTLILSNNVNAWTQNGTISVSSNHSDYGINFPRLSGDKYNYHTNSFSVNFSGKNYTAYCLDPGFNLSKQEPVDCEPADNTYAALAWLVNESSGFKSLDYNTQLLAVRMLAVYTGKNMDVGNMGQDHAGTELVRYLQARDGNGNPDEFMITTNDNARNTVETAYRYANEARNHTNYNSNSSGTNGIGLSAIVTKPSQAANSYGDHYETILEVTVSSSIGKINIDDIILDCGGTCTISPDRQIMKQTETSVTFRVGIVVFNPNCSYKMVVKYAGKINSDRSALYNCKPQDNKTNIQNFLALIPEGDALVDKNATLYTWNEAITSSNGGNYYQNYCTNQNDLVCNQKTTLTKPAFCDDASDQEMSITAPTDIRACILKEEDEAGNTYAMSGFENNKYCSVYCKEDYEMTMPGAQFTTSGRYFQTRNVLVKGTKTCYTSSSNSVSDDTTTNIDIEGFISDMITEQTNLINAYNEYKRYEALYDAVKANEDDHDSQGCGDAKSTWYSSKGTASYEQYPLSFEPNTGEYTGQSSKKQEDFDLSWFYEYTDCKHGTNCTSYDYLGQCTASEPYEYSEGINHGDESPYEDYESKKAAAAAAIQAANDKIRSYVEQYNHCYNWQTDYCFNPEVSFDYQEQYSSSINYEQVSLNVVDNQEIGIQTRSDKKIDNEYSTNPGAPSENVNYMSGSTSSINLSGNPATNISTKNSKIYHLKKIANGTAEYNNRQNFQTNYPHGTMATVPEGSNPRENYSYLGAIFPIAMKTEFGVYNWALKFEDIGQYINQRSCSRLGRLNDVVKMLDNSLNTDIGYVCVYVIDCPDCDFSCACPENMANGYTCVEKTGIDGKYCAITPPCDGGDCDYECYGPDCVYDPPCEGPDCDEKCVGSGCNFCTDGEYPCILTTDEKYIYRAISLTDVFPNNRTIGANWRNEKGSKATTEIEKDGENAYINASYSFKLTAENMRNIRLSNAEIGGFVDYNNIKYEDYNGYQNFLAKSKFIREGKNSRNNFFSELKYSDSWSTYSGTINTSGSGPAWK